MPVLALFLAGPVLSGPTAWGAPSASTLYEQASTAYHSLLKSKTRMQRRDQWTGVIRKFEKVYSTVPRSAEAYKAVFTIGDLYQRLHAVSRRDKDLDRALEYYGKTIDEFNPGRLTDDAHFRQGEIHLSRGNPVAALESFRTVSRKFPQGDVRARAEQRMAEVRPQVSALSAGSPAESSPQGVLEKIDYTVDADSVRVVAHTDRPIAFSQGRLSNPDRVYFNLNQTRLGADIHREFKVGSRFLQDIRLSQFDGENSRMVFDLSPRGKLKVGAWQEGSRLIVELSDETTRNARAVAVAALPAAHKKVAVQLKTPADKAATRHDLPLIVIDAGHGGKDRGAQGRLGLLEKDVNLAIALRLKDILESRYKYPVILTRKDDTFISLEERGAIANERDADVFVSIHANAATRRGAHGIETYYLGTANSEQAKETAARENGELVNSVKDNQVQEILASLISTTKINDSSRLASGIQDRLVRSMKKKYSGIRDLGVKEGPFFVLHDTNMTSVLVEVGFVTHSREERRLKQSAYLDRLASSIALGIAEYIRERGPMI